MKESTTHDPLDETLHWAKFYQEKVARHAPNEMTRRFVESHTDEDLLHYFPAFLVSYAETQVHDYFGGPPPDPGQHESDEAAVEALKREHPEAALWFVVAADALNVLEELESVSRDHLSHRYNQLNSSLIRADIGFIGPELELEKETQPA